MATGVVDNRETFQGCNQGALSHNTGPRSIVYYRDLTFLFHQAYQLRLGIATAWKSTCTSIKIITLLARSSARQRAKGRTVKLSRLSVWASRRDPRRSTPRKSTPSGSPRWIATDKTPRFRLIKGGGIKVKGMNDRLCRVGSPRTTEPDRYAISPSKVGLLGHPSTLPSTVAEVRLKTTRILLTAACS